MCPLSSQSKPHEWMVPNHKKYLVSCAHPKNYPMAVIGVLGRSTSGYLSRDPNFPNHCSRE